MNYGTLPSRFLNAIDNLPNPRAQMVRRDGRWEAIGSQEFLRRVGVFSANRPEWHTADFAINGAGAVTVPVYFNESPDRMTYILKHCAAKVVFVVGTTQLRKLLAVRAGLPELEQIIVADGGAVLPSQLASLIYTSGTTGEPKGVMLTHNNFCSNVTDMGHDFSLDPAEDVALSFLPLAHVYGRFVEKIYARLVEQGSKTTGVKRMIFNWAMNVAHRATPWRATGASASFALKAQWKLADKLVYKKIRLGTGGHLRIVSSGGAPLSKSLAEFFWTVGIPIYQGYGLTETSPIVSSNYPQNRVGSSGRPIPNVQVRVAEDGEILVKGPCVMHGYYKNAEATREVLSEDGWFSTGDIGYLDKDNYLFITDRKKDLLKTAAGKFVAPQPIENALKTSPYILNAMVVGDKRKFIVALIVPNPTTVAAKAADQGIKFASNVELAAHPWVHALIDAEVKRLTVHLAQYETIKRFALLPEDFTFDNGTLTFTLKLKRRVVERKYRNVIESLYADFAEPRPILQD